MARKEFIRKDWKNYSKLGRGRKKLRKYRKAKGEDNKMRLKIKGHLRNVSIGFGKQKDQRGKIKEKTPVLVHNLKELKLLKENQIGIIARIGNKKRLEISNYIKDKKIKLLNLDPEKLNEKINKINQEKKDKKEKRVKKILEKEKKVKKDKKKPEKKEDKPELENSETKKGSEKKEDKPSLLNKIESKDNKKQIHTNNYGRGNWKWT